MDKFIKKLKKMDGFFATGGVDEETVAAMEEELGLSFADDYRNYLKECGQAIADGHELTGSHKSARLNVVSITQKYRKKYNEIPDDWYIVEDLGIDGIMIWQSEDGTVYETNSACEANEIAESLAEYMED